jgi:cell division transport system ATP-binding protein
LPKIIFGGDIVIEFIDVTSSIHRNINLKVEKGSFVYITGKSGSGKSTLLKLLYNHSPLVTGEIRLNGIPVSHIRTHELRRMMGIIYQNYRLLDNKTVFENIALAGEVIGKSRKDILERTEFLLNRVGLLSKKNHFPGQLSGGEQQRVSIARALLNEPPILLADEPTGNLDYENACNIVELILELTHEHRITTLFVTHSKDLILDFPSRLIEIKDGEAHE